MKQRLKELIAEYLQLVVQAHELLTGKYGHDNLLAAYHDGSIPKSGLLDADNGSTFYFHGIGCKVEFDDTVVDFDYGPDGRHDGFDVWRLHILAESSDKYTEFEDIEILKHVFAVLKDDGYIKCPKWSPSPHLYYRTRDIEGEPARRPRPR